MRPHQDVVARAGAGVAQGAFDPELLELARQRGNVGIVVGIEALGPPLELTAGDAQRAGVAQDTEAAPRPGAPGGTRG